MFESYLAPILFQYVTKYIKNLQPEDLKVTLWGGEVVLRNLEIKVDAFSELRLPFSVTSGRIKELRLNVPWHSIQSDHILITVNNVEIFLGPPTASDNLSSSNDEPPSKTTPPPSPTTSASSASSSVIPAWVKSWIDTIRANITFHLNALSVKYILPPGDDGQISIIDLSCRSVSFTPVDENWAAAFIDPGPLNLMRNEIKIRGVGMRIYTRPAGSELTALSLDEIMQSSVLEEIKLDIRLRIPLKSSAEANDANDLTRQIDLFFDSDVAIHLKDFQYDAIMQLFSKPTPPTAAQSPPSTPTRLARSVSSPSTPTTQAKKGWGSWLSWGWNSKPTTTAEPQDGEPQSSSSITEALEPPEAAENALPSPNPSRPSQTPLICNIIMRSGSIQLQNSLSSFSTSDAIGFLKFSWLGVRVDSRIRNGLPSKKTTTLIGARQFSVAETPSTSPSIFFNAHSSPVEPTFVCAPDSFFSTIKTDIQTSEISLEAWQSLYRQLSIQLFDRDYSSVAPPNQRLSLLSRFKLHLSIQDTSIVDADAGLKSVLQFFRSGKQSGRAKDAQTSSNSYNQSPEDIIESWWRKPTMEVDINLYRISAQIGRTQVIVDSLRYDDHLFDNDHVRSSKEPWWTKLAILRHGLTVSGLKLLCSSSKHVETVLSGADLIQVSWVKNLLSSNRAAQDHFSSAFPRTQLDLHITPTSILSFKVRKSSIQAISTALNRVLSIFSTTAAQTLPSAESIEDQQLTIELGPFLFFKSDTGTSTTKLELRSLNVSFDSNSEETHQIVSFAQSSSSNHDNSLSIHTRIPASVVSTDSTPPIVQVSCAPLKVFVAKPLIQWILDRVGDFHSLSGFKPTPKSSLTRLKSLGALNLGLEDTLPHDVASDAIIFFSDVISFQWPYWTNGSVSVDVGKLDVVLALNWSDTDAISAQSQSVKVNLTRKDDFASVLLAANSLVVRRIFISSSGSYASQADILLPVSLSLIMNESKTPSASSSVTKRADVKVTCDALRVSFDPKTTKTISKFFTFSKEQNQIESDSSEDTGEGRRKRLSLTRVAHRRTMSKDHLGQAALATLMISFNLPSIRVSFADASLSGSSLVFSIDNLSAALSLNWRANLIMETNVGEISVFATIAKGLAGPSPLVVCGGASVFASSLYSSGDRLQKALSQSCTEVTISSIAILSSLTTLKSSVQCIRDCLPPSSASSASTKPLAHVPKKWKFKSPIILKCGKTSLSYEDLFHVQFSTAQLSCGMLQQQRGAGADSSKEEHLSLGQLVSLQVCGVSIAHVLKETSIKVDVIAQAHAPTTEGSMLSIEESVSLTLTESHPFIHTMLHPIVVKRLLASWSDIQEQVLLLAQKKERGAVTGVKTSYDLHYKHDLSFTVDIPMIRVDFGDPLHRVAIVRPLLQLNGPIHWRLMFQIQNIEAVNPKDEMWLFWSGAQQPPTAILVRIEPLVTNRSIFVDIHPGACIVVSRELIDCCASMSSVLSRVPAEPNAPSQLNRQDAIAKLYEAFSSYDLKLNIASFSSAFKGPNAECCLHVQNIFVASSHSSVQERSILISIVSMSLQRSVPDRLLGFQAEPNQQLIEPFDTSAHVSISKNIGAFLKIHHAEDNMFHLRAHVELPAPLRVRLFAEDVILARNISKTLERESEPKENVPKQISQRDAAFSNARIVSLNDLALHVAASDPCSSVSELFPSVGSLLVSPWACEGPGEPENRIEGFVFRWRLAEAVSVASADFLLTPILQDLKWNKNVSVSLTLVSYWHDCRQAQIVAEQISSFKPYNPARDHGFTPIITVNASGGDDSQKLMQLSDSWALVIRFSEPLSHKQLIPESMLSLLGCVDVRMAICDHRQSRLHSSVHLELSAPHSVDLEVDLTGRRNSPLDSTVAVIASIGDLRANIRLFPSPLLNPLVSAALNAAFAVSHVNSVNLLLRPILHRCELSANLKSSSNASHVELDCSSGIELETAPSSAMELMQAVKEFTSFNLESSCTGSTQLVVANNTASSLLFGQAGTNESLLLPARTRKSYAWRKAVDPSQRILRLRLASAVEADFHPSSSINIDKYLNEFWSSLSAQPTTLRRQMNFIIHNDGKSSVLIHARLKISEFNILIVLEGSHSIKNESMLEDITIRVSQDSSSLLSDTPQVVLTKTLPKVSFLRSIPSGSASSSTSTLGPQLVFLEASPLGSEEKAVEKVALTPAAPHLCFGSLVSIATLSGNGDNQTSSSITVLRTKTFLRNLFAFRNLTPLPVEFKFENVMQESICTSAFLCASGDTVPVNFNVSTILAGSTESAVTSVAPFRFRFSSLSSWSYPQVLLSVNRPNNSSPTSHLYVKLTDHEQRQVPAQVDVIMENGVQIIQISCALIINNATNDGFVLFRGQSQVPSSQIPILADGSSPAAGILSPDSVYVKADSSIPYYWKSEKKDTSSPVSPLTLGMIYPSPKRDSGSSALGLIVWSNSIEPQVGSNYAFVFRCPHQQQSPVYDSYVLACSRGTEASAPVQLTLKPRYILTNRSPTRIAIQQLGSKKIDLVDVNASKSLSGWARSDSGGLDTRIQISIASNDGSALGGFSKILELSSTQQRSRVFVPADPDVRRYATLVLSVLDIDGTAYVTVSSEDSAPVRLVNTLDCPIELRFVQGAPRELSNKTFTISNQETLDIFNPEKDEQHEPSSLFDSSGAALPAVLLSMRQSDGAWSDPLSLSQILEDATIKLTRSSGRDKLDVALHASLSPSGTLIASTFSLNSKNRLPLQKSISKSFAFVFKAPNIAIAARDRSAHFSRAAAELSPNRSAALSPSHVTWSQLEQEEEVLLLSLLDLSVSYRSSVSRGLLMRLGGAQLDSFIPESQFSVPLSLVPTNSADTDSPEALLVSAKFCARSFFSVGVSFSSELTAGLDEKLLSYIISLSKRFTALKRPKESTHVSTVTPVARLFANQIADALMIPPLDIHSLSVSMPKKVRLSAQLRPGQGRVFVSLSDVSLSFKPLSAKRIRCYSDRLIQALMSHYISEALPQAPAALASLDVIGNPLKLARHVGAGVRDFLVLPIQFTAEKGALGLAEGILRGSGSLFGHITGGVLQSFAGFSQSLARVLDPENQGVFGVTSIVTQPIQAVKSSGITGLARGLTSGLFRAISAPIGGALNFVSATTSDLSDSVLADPISWVRYPRSAIPEAMNINVSSFSTFKYRIKIIQALFYGQNVQLQQLLHAQLIGATSEAPCTILLCSHKNLVTIFEDEVLSVVPAENVKRVSNSENTISIDSSTKVRFPNQRTTAQVMRWIVNN